MALQYLNAKFSDGRDAIEDMRKFVELMGLDHLIPDRYSALLLAQLFTAYHKNTFDPHKVIWQIRALEGVGSNTGLKSATQFKHPPLQGIWHQHFLMDGIASMARNLQKGIHKFGLPWLEQQVAETTKSGEERYLTEADIKLISHDAVFSNLERLRDAEALTGEWILFAKYQNQNYYLTIGAHSSGDDFLRSQIDLIAQTQYKFLQTILNN